MADTFTTSLRLQLQTTGGNNGTWGAIADTQYQLLEAAITGDNGYAGGAGGIAVGGLTTYILTVANGTADQARAALYPFVGALTGNCIVTLPGVVKIGYAANFTTGGHNVILTTGAGTTATLPPTSVWTLFYCDGTNVTIPKNYNQGTFTPGDNGNSVNPTGMLEQWGIALLTGSPMNVNFSPVFPSACDNVIVSAYSSATDAHISGKSNSAFSVTYTTGTFISWRAIGH